MVMSLIYNYKVVLVSMAILNLLYLTYDGSYFDSENDVYMKTTPKEYENEKYIIDTPGCRIENLDPFSDEIKEYVYKIGKMTCRNTNLLTYITRTKESVVLHINHSLVHDYSAFEINCCYSTITRNPTGPHPDDNLSFSDCTYFNDSVNINEDFVKVECSNFLHEVYENVHSTLQPPRKSAPNNDGPNVILIGIDGVSRSNFIRSMPRTYEFCRNRNNWMNLKGYNKIDDNTFPNLMAVLTGMNFTEAFHSCNPYKDRALDKCPHFIWSKYKNHHYSTAYAEDTPKIATFNGIKTGFTDPPTDYYFRPYFLAADGLISKYLCLKAHCTGPEKTGIRMQNLIKDFISTINGSTPGFGLFWMNSFSHEDVNCPSSMDDDFVDFLEEIEENGHWNNTIVILFSDHGFRFGKIRLTHTGWMEERLPFIYIRLPESFRLKHVEEYNTLLDNAQKLTTPYDLYMTLQHILALSNKNYTESPSRGCPQCQSVFRPIDKNRTCNNSGIPQHYCTCSRYEKLHVYTPLVQDVALFFVDKINELVQSYGNASEGCSVYVLSRISHARSFTVKEGREVNILVGIVTNPEAIFEGTIKVVYTDGTDKTMGSSFQLMETNRLDRYAPKTFCVQNSPVKMYCYCKSLLKRFTNIFCNNKFCFLYFLFQFLAFCISCQRQN